jgi:hypothetical protein
MIKIRIGGKIFGFRIVRRRVKRSGSLKGTKKDYAEYKERALNLARERLEYFNAFYGFKIGKVSVKNQKSRWGSCSKKGNLNFNYKIAKLPAKVADYIIIHELCHLGEFNHSRAFWSLVASTMPDYLEIRRSLRKSCIV